MKGRAPSESSIRKGRRMEEIRAIHAGSHEIYGASKIAARMRRNGESISEKTVGNYMRETGIRAHYAKHRTQTTKDSDFSREFQNVLGRDFHPERPDAAWCTDITYLWTYGGFVCLTGVMDLYSRKIISWVPSDTPEAGHAVKAVEEAKRKRKAEKPLVVHSDRGIQYTCKDYISATGGLVRSYSGKACPWDNACMESFHALLKREWISRFRIVDYSHAYRLVFEYIETFYNTVRIHSHRGYQSPGDYEKEYLDRMERGMRSTWQPVSAMQEKTAAEEKNGQEGGGKG